MIRALGLLFIFISYSAFAAQSDDRFFNSLRTENFQIEKFEKCDPSGAAGESTVKSVVEWRPNGLGNYIQPPQCSPQGLETLLLNSSTIHAKKIAISSYFEACGKNLEKFHYGSTRAMAMFSGARYAYCNHPRVRSLKLTFDDGTKLGGVIAIQRPDKNGNNQPRPLVIYKCGVFCEVEDSSTKLMVMHMFDQAPFNIIAVGNNTSADYAAANDYLALGGYDDGMQLVRIAKMVRNSPLSKLVTSIHVVGMSLAGHATLMSSYINEHNVDAFNQLHFSSALALCPVVDLKPSIEFLFADNVRGRVSREVLLRNISKRMSESVFLTQVYKDINSLKSPSQIPPLIAQYASEYYSQKPHSWALPPLDKNPIFNSEDLWKQNNFFNYLSTPIRTPTLVFSALDDWIVTPEPNSVRLDRALQNYPRTSLRSVLVPNGNHCAFAPVYGWDTISTLYSSYIMSHSPEMLVRRHSVKHEFYADRYFTGKLKLQNNERYVRISLELKARVQEATLRAEIWGSDSFFDKSCLKKSIYEGDSKCLRTAETKVPLSELGSWTRIPETQSEAEQLTRWANANLRYLTQNGEPITGNTDLPKLIYWDEY